LPAGRTEGRRERGRNKAHANAPPARASRQAVAVVARGLDRFESGNLGHPVHPARMKNDRVRQVSWLTGQCRSGRLLRTEMSQWRNGRSARRLQLQGQPEFRTPFPFDPLSGNLSQLRTYRHAQDAASANACADRRTDISAMA